MRTLIVMGLVGIGLTGLPLRAAAAELQAPMRLASLPSDLSRQTAAQPSREIIDQLARTYTTPKAIAAYLQTEFTFTRDEDLFGTEDRWQSPEEFVGRKTGDCEDYALLAQAMLRRQGIEAYVLSLLGEEGYAHTVSVFVDEAGRYNVINQGRLKNYRAKSLEAVATAINPAWTVGMIAEQDGARGRIVREIHNDQPAEFIDAAGVPF